MEQQGGLEGTRWKGHGRRATYCGMRAAYYLSKGKRIKKAYE
jgi:hypothetical protein